MTINLEKTDNIEIRVHQLPTRWATNVHRRIATFKVVHIIDQNGSDNKPEIKAGCILTFPLDNQQIGQL